MNKQAIFNHYAQLIDNLIDNSAFFSIYFQAPFLLDEEIHGEDYDELPNNFSLHDGATRGCIVDENYDYVVKFDINGNGHCDSACEYEEKLFEEARARGLDAYLCEMAYIGTYTKTFTFYTVDDIDTYIELPSSYDEEELTALIADYVDAMNLTSITISLPLYAYRRAEYYDYSDLDESLISSAQKIESPLREKQIAVATAFIQNYGFAAYQSFSSFAREFNINDIHQGNIGEVDGRFVIIDWGSYYKGDYDYE